jgi:hypothetical protein
VKYVVLKQQPAAAANPTSSQVVTLLDSISKIWAPCEIRFVLDEYGAVAIDDYRLQYNPANQADLDTYRAAFDDGNHALFVETGTWNRSGTLGNDGSNGFATMPSSNPDIPEGIVFEQGVATNPSLLAHELGHLVGGLDHTGDTTNLMDHFVSPRSTTLTPDQCNQARRTISSYFQDWTR